MRTALVIGLALVTALFLAPGAAAAPGAPSLCDIFANTGCDIPEQLIEDLDPRNWPCTCDPWPQPW